MFSLLRNVQLTLAVVIKLVVGGLQLILRIGLSIVSLRLHHSDRDDLCFVNENETGGGKLGFTHLRGFDNCSLAQDFPPSPVREVRVETRLKLFWGHCENEEILKPFGTKRGVRNICCCR